MRTAIKIIISLDSRHTGFRFYALKKGKELGIVGTISYYGDTGGIVIHAEGKDNVLQQFVNILRQGTPYSKVISIMTIPDRMLNNVYLEIMPTLIPIPGSTVRKSRSINFKIGFFGL
ncbi:MAG: acylphosphatase [Bacteroidota bacterium]